MGGDALVFGEGRCGAKYPWKGRQLDEKGFLDPPELACWVGKAGGVTYPADLAMPVFLLLVEGILAGSKCRDACQMVEIVRRLFYFYWHNNTWKLVISTLPKWTYRFSLLKIDKSVKSKVI